MTGNVQAVSSVKTFIYSDLGKEKQVIFFASHKINYKVDDFKVNFEHPIVNVTSSC